MSRTTSPTFTPAISETRAWTPKYWFRAKQVSLDEFVRWAEPLKGDIARVIAADLGALLGSDSVSVFDTGSDVPPAWHVRVDVMRFDSMPGDAVTVEAQWTVWPPKQFAPVTGHSRTRAGAGAGL